MNNTHKFINKKTILSNLLTVKFANSFEVQSVVVRLDSAQGHDVTKQADIEADLVP
ncbi:hypothetical protein [Metabacillus sp. Hm71]|uniref:hypothetical protein n=1 Tax=Metabacillus sp. Hm71 TaxID=3450743 RepID=UPI003F4266E8